MLLQRLTLACETTFWIVIAASLGAPPLFQGMALSQNLSQAATSLTAPAANVSAPQLDAEQKTVLEHLVAQYETYTDQLQR